MHEIVCLKTPDSRDARDIIAALDHAPFTRRHAVFVAALLTALIFDYAKPFTLSFVIPGVREVWGLSPVEASYLAVAGLTGTMLGSIFWGFVGDRIGRRKTILWTVGLFSLGSVCGLTTEYWQALLACLVMGFGVGGEFPVVFALAAEYLPVRVRARLLALLAIVGATAGYALAALIATFANALYANPVAWRAMWLVQLVAALLVLLLRTRFVPESARFLLDRDRIAEARAAAEHFVGSIARVAQPQAVRETRVLAERPPRLYGRTIALSFFSFAWGLANFGFVTWLPTLLRSLGYAGAAPAAYLALSAVVALPALVLTAYLLTRWSTRWTLVAYALGGAASLVALGAGATAGLLTPPVLVAASGLVFFFITSLGGAFSVYAAEVFPTRVRARRGGLVAGLGKLGGVIGPYLGGLWLAGGGSALGLQLPFAAALVLAAATLALAGMETRGRTLEQIDAGE